MGLDIGSHSCDLIFAGYPRRMPAIADDAIRILLDAGLLGQKGGAGFYLHEPGAGARSQRRVNPRARQLLAARIAPAVVEISDEHIIERLMLAMIVESVHALAEGVVASAAELDRALLLGIGFPLRRGGALRHADALGAATLLARCEHYRHLGEAYAPPPLLQALARDGGRFHDEGADLSVPRT